MLNLPCRLLGFTAIVAVAAIHAQEPPAQRPPVFRGGTTIVPLTVTVLDKQGKPVTDLTQADFTVFENAVRQDIRGFFPQRMTPGPIVSETVATTPRVATDPLLPQTRRIFLVVLGPGRIQVPAGGVDGAMRFVRERLLPQDLVAVLAFNRATEFTTDHAQVLQFLERYKRGHERIFFQIRFRLVPGDLPDSIHQQIDAVFAGETARSALGLLLGMDSIRPLNERAWNRQPTLSDVQKGAERSRARLSDLLIVSPSLKLYAAIEYLRRMEGQKHLVWLGGGLRLRTAEDAKRMAARANDARVVMNIIHTGGVGPSDTGAGFSDISAAQDITQFTGGFFTGVRYAHEALARVDERSRFSYLLGYAPSDSVADGKYRQVKVTVNRPGVTVQFQHGYYAVDALPPLELRETLTAARLESVASTDEVADDLKLDVKASPADPANRRKEMNVEVTVDAARLSFERRADGRHIGALDLQIFCGDAKQKPVGDLRRRIDLALLEDTYQRALREGIRVTARVPVTATVKHIKVGLYEYSTDRLGSFFLTVK